jgi:hypothetical protein
MTERGDEYRIQAAEMHIKAQKNERFREEFEGLMLFYLRLADQADRNEQMFEPPSTNQAQRVPSARDG